MIILLLGLLFSPVSSKINAGNFFVECDTNNDKQLTVKEVSNCFEDHPHFSKLGSAFQSDGPTFISLIDENDDEKISIDEYTNFLKTTSQTNDNSNEEFITVKTRDGKVRSMSREEMESKVAENSDMMKGVKKMGDKLFKEDETRGTIEDLAKKNPAMGRFVQLGKWSRLMLIKMGVVKSETKIMQLKSLPEGGTVYMDKEGFSSPSDDLMMSFRSNFTTWLLLSLEDTSRKGRKEVSHFELKVEFHPKLYRKPFLALLNGWELDGKKNRIKELTDFPTPRYQDESLAETLTFALENIKKRYGEKNVVYVALVGLSLVAAFLLSILFCCLRGGDAGRKVKDQ